MFSNLSASINDSQAAHPITDGTLPFKDYISKCRELIENRRLDLEGNPDIAETIINANCPFEFIPENPVLDNGRYKYGALMIHGLLDCPFSFREIGAHLQQSGILARSILLPGHGTNAADLMTVSYHDWIQSLRYGVESLRRQADNIYLIGYSTGAALSIYHAIHDSKIDGIILLSPAIKVRAPVDMAANWYYITNYFGRDKNWVYRSEEIDYTKYRSIPFNAVRQVAKITETIRELGHKQQLKTPMYMILTREDETISSHHAIDFFTTQRHADSEMLLYTSIDHAYPDTRIKPRVAVYPDLNIKHLSHTSLPFSAANQHYGVNGDYVFASHSSNESMTYGAYNRVEIKFLSLLKKLRLTKKSYRELTYNPDFSFMAESIKNYIMR